MRHTPGPWEWVEDRFNGGYSGIVGKDGAEVLFPNHRNDGDSGDAWFEDFPNEADRNLMVAAPELLEALKRLAAYGNIFRYAIWERNPYEQAMEAIAKAEGREYTPESPD